MLHTTPNAWLTTRLGTYKTKGCLFGTPSLTIGLVKVTQFHMKYTFKEKQCQVSVISFGLTFNIISTLSMYKGFYVNFVMHLLNRFAEWFC